MFDNTCKYLAATYPEDLAAWLLGEPQTLVELPPQELALDPIRADSLVLLRGESLLLHVEFQTQPDPEMPLRMLDYWVRMRRKFPGIQIRQTVMYLRPSTSPKVFEDRFGEKNTEHRYEVMRLWEREPAELMARAGTLPLAILARTEDKENLLREMAERMEGLREAGEVAAATYVLAGLVMGDNEIERILRRDVMKESVTYQKILAEGIEKGIYQGIQAGRREGIQLGKQEGIQLGKQEGIQLGKQEGIEIGQQSEARLVLRLLSRRFGELSDRHRRQITGLSLAQLEDLGEALLDFQNLEQLEAWLGDRPNV
jgi:predicted transposase/invertase (TIGR01784 family)